MKLGLEALNGIASHALFHPVDMLLSVGPTLSETTCGLLGSSFDPERDVPDLSGKVIFVTGGIYPTPSTGFSPSASY